MKESRGIQLDLRIETPKTKPNAEQEGTWLSKTR
jgi:hypothetical protein